MKKKYLRNGNAGDLIEVIDADRCLVANIYVEMDYDGDEHEYSSDNLYIVDRVYDKPPTQVLNKQVADLKNELTQLQNERFQLKREIQDIERQQEKDKKKIEKYPDLIYVFAWLEGKITHYVENHWGTIYIIKIEDAKSEYDEREFVY